MDWKKIWLLYRRKIWIAVVITFLTAVVTAGGYRIVKALTKGETLYRTSSDYYITFNFDEHENSVDYYNAYTWDSILRDDPIVDGALNNLPKDYTKEEVKAAITGEMLGDYRILTVHATHRNPVRAEEIATAYISSLEQFANKIEMLNTIELWSKEACTPVKEADLTGNAAILGAILGLLLTLTGGMLYLVLDDSLYLEQDFEKRFEVPFLGILTKDSNLWKQELKENLSHLLRENGAYYPVYVKKSVFMEETNAKMGKTEQDASAYCKITERMKEASDCVKDELILQGEDLKMLRDSKGAILMIPWGSKNGNLTGKVLSFLKKQDCPICGAVLYNADETFLRKYYNVKK